MESGDTAALRRRFLEAVAGSGPELHAADLRIPGLDRRTVQKRLERLRRAASGAGGIATDAETIAFAKDELLRTGSPTLRGLAVLRGLAEDRAAAFARSAGLQGPVIGDWVELAHSPGDLGWTREQMLVEELGADTVASRGRLQGWGAERERYLEKIQAGAAADVDLLRNLEPNLLKMDLAGIRAWGTSDAPLCAIQVAPVDWLTCFALNARLDSTALTGGAGETVRERWGEPVRVVERRALPGMIVAHVVVLTRDGQFVVCRRPAAGVEDERGAWSLSLEERWQGSAADRAADTHPHDLVRRAVREELGVAVGAHEVRILAWGLEASVLYPGFIAIAHSAAASWEVERLRSHAKDASELAYVGFLPARLAAARLLLADDFVPADRPELAAPWHRTGRARLFLALAHLETRAGRDGRVRVLAQLAR